MTIVGFRQQDIPVDIDRDDAREAARRELGDAIYQAHEPSLLERAWAEVVELLDRLFSALPAAESGGIGGLFVLLALIVAVAVAVRLRVGKMTRSHRAARPVHAGRVRGAAEHRRAAEEAFAGGDLGQAVTERFRALARELEQRGVLDEQTGRTADEVTAQAGRLLPASATGLRDGARIFDDVFYGDRQATEEGYHLLCAVDESVRTERPVLAEAAR